MENGLILMVQCSGTYCHAASTLIALASHTSLLRSGQQLPLPILWWGPRLSPAPSDEAAKRHTGEGTPEVLCQGMRATVALQFGSRKQAAIFCGAFDRDPLEWKDANTGTTRKLVAKFDRF